MPATSWLSMDKISCKTAARSTPRHRRRTRRMQMLGSPPRHRATRRPAPMAGGAHKLRSRIAPQESADESIKAVHFAAGRHHVADGGDSASRFCRVPAVACFRPPTSRLPDDSGANLLPRGQPGCNGVFRNGAARAAVWSGPRTEPDDLDELLRQLADHLAVRSQSEYRRRRAGSASLHQWRLQSFAAGTAEPADL